MCRFAIRCYWVMQARSPAAWTATFPCVFLLPHTLHENPIGRENKACPVSVCPGDHFCPGNIGSCFWTAHPLNMTPSDSLKHFSTTSEGYERIPILNLCGGKKTVTSWKKWKKGEILHSSNVQVSQRFLVKVPMLFNIKSITWWWRKKKIESP